MTTGACTVIAVTVAQAKPFIQQSDSVLQDETGDNFHKSLILFLFHELAVVYCLKCVKNIG
jgi:hypothetical protein